MQGSHQIDPHEPVQVIEVHVCEAGQLHITEDRCVVDQVVDAAEGLDDGGGHGIGTGRVTHVGGHEQGPLTELTSHPATTFLVDFGHHYSGTLGVEPPGVCLAYAPSCACDHGDSICETTGHRVRRGGRASSDPMAGC